MLRLSIILLALLSLKTFGQDNPTDRAQPIVAEGKRLYKSEMASWLGTDLFLATFKDQTKIGGYFSYSEEDGVSKCIFFSNADLPKVIGTISFDSTFTTKTASTDFRERDFTENEKDLYTFRKKALALITSDTLFKNYQNTSLNLIPINYRGEKKVYVLTGPEQQGVVILGNDYLLTFDKDNNLISKRQLHQNIIPIQYGGREEGRVVEGSMHSHSPETGDFITATDICTLLLYGKFTKWKMHHVVSQNYLNIWDCLTEQLKVIPRESIEKEAAKTKKRNR